MVPPPRERERWHTPIVLHAASLDEWERCVREVWSLARQTGARVAYERPYGVV